MIPSAGAYKIIKKWEGLVDGKPDTPLLDPYVCPAGIPTIGWGSTWWFDGSPITMETRGIARDEAQTLLERELNHTTGAIRTLVKVPLNQNQFDALSSFIYNVGSGNFQSSTLRMKLNRGDYDAAQSEFWKWRRANGKILRGLVRRRAEEESLFARLPNVQNDPVLSQEKEAA